MTWKGSPNFTKGRGGNDIDFIVCHWIVGRISAADAVFAKNPGVSAHYAVDDNTIHQYVKEEDTAWHAGDWDANQNSIGIEHAGSPTYPITEATYRTSAGLIASIWKRYGKLPLRKHSDFRATQCPGTLNLTHLENLANSILNPPNLCLSEKAKIISLNKQLVEVRGQLQQMTSRVTNADNNIRDLNIAIKELTIERNTLSTNHDRLLDALKICMADLKTCEEKPPIIKPAEELSAWQMIVAGFSKLFTRKEK